MRRPLGLFACGRYWHFCLVVEVDGMVFDRSKSINWWPHIAYDLLTLRFFIFRYQSLVSRHWERYPRWFFLCWYGSSTGRVLRWFDDIWNGECVGIGIVFWRLWRCNGGGVFFLIGAVLLCMFSLTGSPTCLKRTPYVLIKRTRPSHILHPITTAPTIPSP